VILVYSYISVGHKAGYLGSAFFIGNFFGSPVWGWTSDKIGRRPVLLSGVASTVICELLFGFSQNFAWAIISRFVWGMLNGNIGVVKTYISEVGFG
jgi:MFS family permease